MTTRQCTQEFTAHNGRLVRYDDEFKVFPESVQDSPGAKFRQTGRVCVYQSYSCKGVFAPDEWQGSWWIPIDYFDTQ